MLSFFEKKVFYFVLGNDIIMGSLHAYWEISKPSLNSKKKFLIRNDSPFSKYDVMLVGHNWSCEL